MTKVVVAFLFDALPGELAQHVNIACTYYAIHLQPASTFK